MVQEILNYSDKHPLTFCTFAVTFSLNTATQFYHIKLWLLMMYHQTKFVSRRVSVLEDTVETITFDNVILTMTLTLKLAHQAFRMTLQLMIMHHNTKFGLKRLSSSRDIIWTQWGHWDRHVYRLTDPNIPLPNFVKGGAGGYKTLFFTTNHKI